MLGKEEALQKVIDKDLEEGLVPGPFSWEQLSTKYPKVLLNSLGAEIKDLAKPDVRALADATQGGARRAFVLPSSLQELVFQIQCDFGPPYRSGRIKKGRAVCPSPGDCAGAGTRAGLDYGAQRAILREYRRHLRGGLDRPKLGPSQYRIP